MGSLTGFLKLFKPDGTDVVKRVAHLNENLDKIDAGVLAEKTAREAHENNTSNPHQVSAAQIGAATASALNAEIQARQSHETNINNPHQVTAAQIGALLPAAIEGMWANGNVELVLASPGHIKLPNGLIVQWIEGREFSASDDGQVVDIDFPIQFQDKCCWVGLTTIYVNGGYSNVNRWFQEVSKDKTKVSILCQSADSLNGTIKPGILAIGK